jgi:hypothetical protein
MGGNQGGGSCAHSYNTKLGKKGGGSCAHSYRHKMKKKREKEVAPIIIGTKWGKKREEEVSPIHIGTKWGKWWFENFLGNIPNGFARNNMSKWIT